MQKGDAGSGCPACAFDLAFDPSENEPLESTEQIGPYKIEEEIGEDGFGLVNRAEQAASASRNCGYWTFEKRTMRRAPRRVELPRLPLRHHAANLVAL